MATSPWNVLGDEDEWEQVHEPFHAERPLAPFLCPPLPPPQLRPTAPVVGPKLPLRQSPQAHQHPMRCLYRGGGGGRHPHFFLPPPSRLRFARSRLSPRRGFPWVCSAKSSFGVGLNDRVGVLVVGYQQGLDEGKGRGGSRLSSMGRTIHASPGRFH